MTVVKVATKMLEDKVTLTGALLTSIISILTGVIIGSIIFFVTEGIWQSLVATSVSSLLGERLGHWFVYDFKIDKALNEVSNIILDRIKKFLK